MFLSVFDMFKIGIGPSSSHTMGPMMAAGRFLDRLTADGLIASVARVAVTLHGSLAFTGKGHGTDGAVVLGLLGEKPETIDPDRVPALLEKVAAEGAIDLAGKHRVRFDAATDLVFDFGPPLPGHANGMVLCAYDASGRQLLERTYYSIGGGFVLSGDELAARDGEPAHADVPYGFRSAAEMLEMGKSSGLSIADMKRANELSHRSESELQDGLDAIWNAMTSCMARGLREEGKLPGGLGVKRRARHIFRG